MYKDYHIRHNLGTTELNYSFRNNLRQFSQTKLPNDFLIFSLSLMHELGSLVYHFCMNWLIYNMSRGYEGLYVFIDNICINLDKAYLFLIRLDIWHYLILNFWNKHRPYLNLSSSPYKPFYDHTQYQFINVKSKPHLW